MHELGITENILDITLTKANEEQATKVLKINLVIGELSGFVAECIQFYFDTLSKATIAEGAALNFETAPVELRCRNCSAVFRPRDALWSCPKCGSQGAEIFKGRGLYIDSVEVE